MTTITLPSNACMKLFPDNTATEYETQLANTINLGSGKYEAGLTSIIYPNDFYSRIKVRSGEENLYGIGYDRGPDKKEFFSPAAGTYRTALELLRSIENQNRDDVKVVGSPERQNIVVSFTNDVLDEPDVSEDNPQTSSPSNPVLVTSKEPVARRELFLKLREQRRFCQKPAAGTGFVTGSRLKFIHHLETIVLPDVSLRYLIREIKPSEDDGILEYINVYSDLIQPREAGGKLEPLLRTVVVKGRRDIFQQARYIKPYYFPLVRNSFQNIKVWLRNKRGDKIRFRNTPLIVELHIRRVATPL